MRTREAIRCIRSFCLVLVVLLTVARDVHAAPGTQTPGITLIGTASIAGDATDKSGLTGTLADGTPANRLGAFGSAIAWTGKGTRYVAASDRGPANGDVDYACRFHDFDIAVRTDTRPAVTVTLVSTTILKNAAGVPFTGLSSAFDKKNQAAGLRLDPEGIRVGPGGTLFISDEYGPFVREFSREGVQVNALPVPAAFGIAHPHAKKDAEIKGNTSGRVTNKGFEGLAISPDGTKLYALLQAPLIQDAGHVGLNCRLLEITRATGATRQFVVPLGGSHLGFNELLAINESTFLAIERDNGAGAAAKMKTLTLIDIADATDVSAVTALPAGALPAGIVPVRKRRFLDFLDPKWGLAGASFPEKIEGLAFGPNLPDGRHTLVVTTDNDVLADQPSWFWVFAIDRAALGMYVPQQLPK